ncbi:unnamed protein product [Boreogadus saida]
MVCSAHFREEDYDQGDVRMVSLGLKRLAHLIPNAVPSVHTHLSACPAPRPRGTKISAASRKRELAMMLTDASTCETTDSVNAATVEDPLPYSTCDTGTQCILKPLGRSHAVQVNLKPKMVSMGTQTFTPLTSPDPTDGEDDLSVISDASWVPGDQGPIPRNSLNIPRLSWENLARQSRNSQSELNGTTKLTLDSIS